VTLIGGAGAEALPMEGVLPPELEGTLFRVGPGGGVDDRAGLPAHGESDVREVATLVEEAEPVRTVEGARVVAGAVYAVELREGRAVSYLRRETEADAGVLWHAGSLLALPERGIPLQFSRFLEVEAFSGRLSVPISSHLRSIASDGSRVLFTVESGGGVENEGVFLRVGEWDAKGALQTAQSVPLERETWQHDIGVTAEHILFIESPTARLTTGDGAFEPVPFGWIPGSEGWLGVVTRHGDGSDVRWFSLDPCLVTHVLGAWQEGGAGQSGDESPIVMYVCRYDAPEEGQPIDLEASVVGPAGIGLSAVGGSLGVLERWRIAGGRLERVQLDDRFMEYPRLDPLCEASAFRYGYAVEMGGLESGMHNVIAPDAAAEGSSTVGPVGLLKYDMQRGAVAGWRPPEGRRPTEPLFARATDGHGDDEGWLLTLVDDEERGGSDLYVLDASTLGSRRQRPEAVIHLPDRLPLRSHSEWVPAARYR
jgi:carotenoid cleavage dioxygenase-like enzyme